MIVSLLVYIVHWIGMIIYSVKDADWDYKKIKFHGGIYDHTPEVLVRSAVFFTGNLTLAFFVPHFIFLIVWNVLAIGTYSLVFEARINRNLGKSFLYTGTTAVWDKFFLKMPHGDIVKVLVKAIIFAIGLYASVVLYMNFGVWMK